MIAAPRLRRAVRRETIGVDVGAALNLVGALLRYLSLAFAFPAVIAVIYDEAPWPFVAAGAVTAALGAGLEAVTRGKERVGVREGFLVVALTWLGAALIGGLPYLFAGEPQLSSPVDAWFEAMSGFTTTGASVLTDIEAMPRSLLMWRQFTQWLGGMGIIVLALAVLPRLRIGGRQLLESEMPGPEVEPLTASIRDTARRLWVLYVALTAALVGLLSVYGATGVDPELSLYDAAGHAFTTLPTGGFGLRADSLASFAAATQWTVTLFMLVAGVNFALLYAAFARGRPRALARDEEFRLYVALAAAASLILFGELLARGLFEGEAALRHAAFQTVSMMTTTGFASADFALWTPLALVVLIGAMLIGGSAGSTTGSIKVVRHLIIGKSLRRELDLTVHPELVSPLRFNGRPLDERTVRAVIAFVLLYVGLFALGAFLITIDAAVAGAHVSPYEAIAASATTLGNVGPGLGFAGPFGSFEEFSGFSKVVMIVLMWLGRLELVPVIVLLTKRYWRA